MKKARDGAHEVRGTSVLRRPERSVDIEPSSPGSDSKNKTSDTIWYHSFVFESARRGSNPRPPPWQGGAPPLSHSRILFTGQSLYLEE